MKVILISALALGVTTSVALAEAPRSADSQAGPVTLTDAQMEAVTAGQGVNVGGIQVQVTATDVVDVRNVDVAVNAAAAIAVLGGAGAVAAQD